MEEVLRWALMFWGAMTAISAALNASKERPEFDIRKNLRRIIVIYLLAVISVLAWWPAADMWSAIGKYTVVALFTIDLIDDLVCLKYPLGPVHTTLRASIIAAGALLVVVCAVFLWP